MGRIESFFGGMLTIMLLIFLSGCSISQKKESIETLPAEKLPATEQPQPKVMITSGTRTLPETCNAGDVIEVKIDIVPANQISGVIVREKIPDTWEIIKSEPQFSKIEQGNVYKWLQWGKQVLPFTIIYQVKVSQTAKGKYFFEGTIMTYREGNIPILGNSETVVK